MDRPDGPSWRLSHHICGGNEVSRPRFKERIAALAHGSSETALAVASICFFSGPSELKERAHFGNIDGDNTGNNKTHNNRYMHENYYSSMSHVSL